MAASGDHIHIGTLDLRAPDRAAAQRFRNDLEDAFRTATLPRQAQGARLFLRRLNLGRMPQNLSRQALSRHLARVLAATPVETLHWDNPADISAEVVAVPDQITAAAMALRSSIAGTAPHWAVARMFAPALSGSDPAARITAIIDALIASAGPAAPGRIAAMPGGVQLLITVLETVTVATLHRWSDVVEDIPIVKPILAAPIDQPDRPPAQSADVSVPAKKPDQAQPDTFPVTVSPALRAVITQAGRRWHVTSDQMLVLTQWVAIAGSGPTAARYVRTYLDRLARPNPGQTPAGDAQVQGRGPKLSALGTPDAPTQTDRSRKHPDPSTDSADRKVNATRQATPDQTAAGEFSAQSGLWLLLSVLRYLACEQAECALQTPLCQQVMHGFATRLGLPETDPAHVVLDPAASGSDPVAGALWCPHQTVLQKLAGRRGLYCHDDGAGPHALLLRAGGPAFAFVAYDDLHKLQRAGLAIAETERARDAHVIGMTLAVQRLTAQLTGGMGWRRLAARRGQVKVTPTHIDVTFDGRDVSTPVRLAALDINPGWVPWLGRVVQFHYDFEKVRDFAGDAP